MVEHLVYTEEVGGSSPSPPTIAAVRIGGGLFILIAWLFWSLPAGAQTPAETWQLVTGQDYLDLAEYDRETYVSGLNDAYNWSFAGGFDRLKWLPDCARGKRAAQLAAIFTKWLRANPERWHEPAAKLYTFALFDACPPDAPRAGQESR